MSCNGFGKRIKTNEEIDIEIIKLLYRAMKIRNDVFGQYSEPEQKNDHIIEIAKMIQREGK